MNKYASNTNDDIYNLLKPNNNGEEDCSDQGEGENAGEKKKKKKKRKKKKTKVVMEEAPSLVKLNVNAEDL